MQSLLQGHSHADMHVCTKQGPAGRAVERAGVARVAKRTAREGSLRTLSALSCGSVMAGCSRSSSWPGCRSTHAKTCNARTALATLRGRLSREQQPLRDACVTACLAPATWCILHAPECSRAEAAAELNAKLSCGARITPAGGLRLPLTPRPPPTLPTLRSSSRPFDNVFTLSSIRCWCVGSRMGLARGRHTWGFERPHSGAV